MLSRNAKTYNEEDSLIVEHARILTETLWKFIKYVVKFFILQPRHFVFKYRTA